MNVNFNNCLSIVLTNSSISNDGVPFFSLGIAVTCVRYNNKRVRFCFGVKTIYKQLKSRL